MPKFTAYSISTTVLGWLCTHPRRWRVISTHPQACNLLSEDGDLLALASPRYGNGPFHIVAPEELFAGVQQDEAVRIGAGQLQMMAGVLDTRDAEVWSPRLPRRAAIWSDKTIARDRRFWLCENTEPVCLSAHDQLMQQFDQLAKAGLHALQAGWRHHDLRQFEAGTCCLSGLGPGLTPAGDDLLVGWLAGILYFGERCGMAADAAAVGQLVAASAVPRTTRLSAAWLRHAGAGEFGEPWHQLANGLDSGAIPIIERAVRRILNTGATSGQAAMIGFRHAQRLFAAGLVTPEP